MSQVSGKACARCHFKKIKCDGTSRCNNCRNAAATCEPYVRLRRGASIEALKRTQKRLQWLEEEISQIISTQCAEIETGTSLRQHFLIDSDSKACTGAESVDTPPENERSACALELQKPTPSARETSEISMLALNAIGELRFLGPSSGSFVTNYALSLARSFAANQYHENDLSVVSCGQMDDDRVHSAIGLHQVLPIKTVELLCQSYQMWVQPLYPILYHNQLEDLKSRSYALQSCTNNTPSDNEDLKYDVVILFLIMALGATNVSYTVEQLQEDPNQETPVAVLSTIPPATLMYSRALDIFERSARNLHPSLPVIQIILLILMFGSYGRVQSSQWQLAGLAMRMAVEIGLHQLPSNWQISGRAVDQRNCVFWSAFAIEVSLAYNLGRPSSIPEDHISADLPVLTETTALSLRHIRHRQIQGRIVSMVYGVGSSLRNLPLEDKQQMIRSIHDELDAWQASLDVLRNSSGNLAYPLSYWERLYYGTTFVLHRSSPLCPELSPESAEICVRSAGKYIDNINVVLRESHVPLSWMLVQGILFAGLTMLVTARTNTINLVHHAGTAFLLVDFPTWTRKCSICLAIASERWKEDLLRRLETRFEALASYILKLVITTITTIDDENIERPTEDHERATPPPTSNLDSWRSSVNKSLDITECPYAGHQDLNNKVTNMDPYSAMCPGSLQSIQELLKSSDPQPSYSKLSSQERSTFAEYDDQQLQIPDATRCQNAHTSEWMDLFDDI